MIIHLFGQSIRKVMIDQLLLVCILAACSGGAPTPMVTATVSPAVTALPGQPASPSQAAQSQLEVVWTSTGAPDTFSAPDGLGLDSKGNLYVVDGRGQVQKLDSQGKRLARWGSSGKEDGQFTCNPCGLAVDGQDNVYIADTHNNRVQKFDANGKFLAKWGTSGAGEGQFKYPFGITTDRQGNIYVGDVGNARIQKFDTSGKFLAKWGSSGSGDGQFSWDLADLAVDAQGNVYVSDRSNGLQKFDVNGKFLAKIDQCGDNKRMAGATGMAFDTQGNFYVYDRSNHRICKYDPHGQFLTSWDGLDNAVGFLAVDQQGYIYAAEVFHNQVKKFRQP